MKFLSQLLTLAAMAVAVAAEGVRTTQKQRRLDDFDTLCTMCSLCDALDPACDFGLIDDFACILCDTQDDSETDGGSVCFSGLATVQVQGGQTTMMKDLQVGDRILTDNGNYETVYAFAHHNPSRKAEFFQIFNKESTKAPLEMTAEHLVFIQGQSVPIPAEQVKVGDVLRTAGSNAGSMVTKINKVQRDGIYAPLTTSGSLVVDGVVASSYIYLPGDKNDHEIIHFTLAPFRMLCMGVSARLCENSLNNEDGMPHIVHFGLELLKFVLGMQSVILQSAGLAIIFAFSGAFRVAEIMFGASWAPLILAGLGMAAFRRSRQSKTKAL